MNLNLGCGSQVHDGWVNVDYAVGARLAKMPLFRALNKRLRLFQLSWDHRIYVHDLTRPFPWAGESVDAVYSSHMLEHLTRAQGREFLRECHRVLRKGGVIRIIVPDLHVLVEEYRRGAVRADEFVERLGVLYGTGGSGIRSRLAHLIHFPHQCMYDTATLVGILREIGFAADARAPFDSRLGDIRLLELAERVERAVIVEGVK